MTKKVLIFLAEGSEETEAVTTIDLLTRAGIVVVSASITEEREVRCSRGVVILAQKTFSQVKDAEFDAVVLPGGLKGAENFRDSPALIEKLKQMHYSNQIIAAICASPAVVLQYHDLFPYAYMTGFPEMKKSFKFWKSGRVYFDREHKLLTSQGLGTSIDFALKIIDILAGKQKTAEVARQLVLPYGIDDYS